MHNLESARIGGECSGVGFIENFKMRRCAMRIALEVNFALWIMIGWGVAEVAQFVGY